MSTLFTLFREAPRDHTGTISKHYSVKGVDLTPPHYLIFSATSVIQQKVCIVTQWK